MSQLCKEYPGLDHNHTNVFFFSNPVFLAGPNSRPPVFHGLPNGLNGDGIVVVDTMLSALGPSTERVLLKRQQMDHPCLCKILCIESKDKEEWCGTNSTVSIIFEYSAFHLSVDSYRQVTSAGLSSATPFVSSFNQPMNSEQILDIVMQVVELQKVYFETLGFYFDDFHPDTLQFDPFTGKLKICDLVPLVTCGASEKYACSGYGRMVRGSPFLSPLSPQLLRHLAIKTASPNIDQEKSSIFSFGIVLLSFLTSTPFDSLFDLPNYQLSPSAFLGCLASLASNQSNQSNHSNQPNLGVDRFTVCLVSSMLDKREAKRGGWRGIGERVSRHLRKEMI